MFGLLCSPPSTVGLPPNFHASGSSSGRSDDQQPVKDAKKDAKKKPAAAVKSKAGKKKVMKMRRPTMKLILFAKRVMIKTVKVTRMKTSQSAQHPAQVKAGSIDIKTLTVNKCIMRSRFKNG